MSHDTISEQLTLKLLSIITLMLFNVYLEYNGPFDGEYIIGVILYRLLKPNANSNRLFVPPVISSYVYKIK